MKKTLTLILLVYLVGFGNAFADNSAATRSDRQLAIQKIDEYIQETVEKNRIQALSYAILLNGEPIHKNSVGVGDESGAALNEKTIFPIASITKLFVSTAVHEQLLSHDISVDAPIGAFLTDIPSHWQHIKIASLLAHTSGLPDYYSRNPEPETTAKALSEVSHLPFEFNEGEHSQYNQTGYALLHLLAETLSGVSLKEYLQQHHFTKFNLQNTYFPGDTDPNDTNKEDTNQESTDRKNTIKTYRKTWAGVQDFIFSYPPAVYGSAGLNASAEDLSEWMRVLLDGQILPQEYLLRVWEPVRLNNGQNGGFSLGWEYYESENVMMAGHGGANTAEVRHFLHKKTGNSVTVIWLSNTIGFDPHNSVNKIASHFMSDIPQ